MCERGGCAASHDGRRFVDQLVPQKRIHHEQGIVSTPRLVALEDGIAYVPAPNGQTLALPFFQVTAAYDGPEGVAGKDAPAGFDLVVDVNDARQAAHPPGDSLLSHERCRVNVLPVARDMPAAGKDETRLPLRVIKHRLRRSR